jgi:putative transposase
VTGQHRSTQRKPLIKNSRLELRQRMHEIVRTRVRYGYRRVHIVLEREDWSVRRNLIHRLYREERLALRGKQPRRRKMVVHREGQCQPQSGVIRRSTTSARPTSKGWSGRNRNALH